jgi:hypothetical protein
VKSHSRQPRARAAFVVALVVAVLCGAAPDAGAEPSAAEVAVARRAFADATELEKAERWVEAEAKLREALAIKETPGLRYHLGFCLENQGKLVGAMVEFDRADEMLRLGAKAPDVAAMLEPARDRVRKQVAEVTLKLSGRVANVVIEIDGVAVKAALVGKGVPQNPGRRVITATAPGRQPFRREVQLAEGEVREIVIDLPVKAGGAGVAGATPSAAAASEQGGAGNSGTDSEGASLDSATPSSARTWVLVGEAAVTALALGAGIFFTIQAGDSKDEIARANEELDSFGYDQLDCGAPPSKAKRACEQLADLTDQRDRQKNLALVGFVGAGVGAAATVATFFLWKPAPRSAAALRVTPVATPRSLGLGVVGRF